MALRDLLAGKGNPDKHAILDVIEYSGPNNVLVWKHSCENFNTGSQLIVAESQVAVFFKDGVALQSFPAGRYTLTTQNYPFIRALVRTVTGGKSPFQCAVYFVNKVISMGISWGTDSPIRMNDPVYNLPIDITSYGDFSVQVQNEKQLLCELVGTTTSYSQDEITRFFGDMIATKVRSLLTGVLIEKKLSPLGIDAYLDEISGLMLPKVQGVFEPYGICVRHFVVAKIGYTGLEAVEAQMHTQTVQNIAFSGQLQRDYSQRDFNIDTQLKQGQAVAEVNRMQGLSELQKRALEVAKEQAANPGPIMSGNSFGIGMPGTPVNLGGTQMQSAGAATTESLRVIAEMGAGTVQAPVPPAPAPITPGVMPGGLCGTIPPASASNQEDSFATKVERLAFLRDKGIITGEEFEKQKQLLIDETMKGGAQNA